MATQNLQKLIGTYAPILATALGSPIAGMAMALIANLFGIDKNDTQGLIDKITLDPDSKIKLKELENEHLESLQQIVATNYQTEVDDRKSAREREENLHDNMPRILSIGFLITYALIQLYCITHPGTEDDIISARLQDILVIIVSYYFGSSHKEKSAP